MISSPYSRVPSKVEVLNAPLGTLKASGGRQHKPFKCGCLSNLIPPVQQDQIPSFGCSQGGMGRIPPRHPPASPAPGHTILCPKKGTPELPASRYRPSTREEGWTWSLWLAGLGPSSITWSRSGLVAPLPGKALQIGNLEEWVGLFLIETVTSLHLRVRKSGP